MKKSKVVFCFVVCMASLYAAPVKPYGVTLSDNPVSYVDGVNDCDVIKYNGEYYITGNWLGGDMLSSSDLEQWGSRTHVFSYINTWHTPRNPADPDRDIHASHIRYYNGTFHLYAQLDKNAPEVYSITHATSGHILGPYTELTVTAPFTTNIDAETFMDEDGKFYFYDVRFNSGNRIYGRTMTDLNTLSGSWTQLLYGISGWENSTTINEGPKVFKYRGLYYMLYNAYDTGDANYSIGCSVAASPLGFSNSGKYTSAVLTRTTPPSGGEINTIGQAWVVDGINGFEKWLGYFAVAAGRRDQCIDRMQFFDKKLVVKGPTNRYTAGYHPGPAKPQLLSLFNIGSGVMSAADWTPLSAGTWDVNNNEARQLNQTTFSFTKANRASATNYLIEANVKFIDPLDAEDKCGVLAYFQDWNNWMIVGLDRAAGSWYCHRKENGINTVVGSPLGSFDFSVYHKIRVMKNGSKFDIVIDDRTPPNYAGAISTIFSGDGIPGLYSDHAAAAYDGVIYTIGWDEYDNTVRGWGTSITGQLPVGTWTYGSAGITQTAAGSLNYTFKGNLMPQYEFSTQVTKSGTLNGRMGIIAVSVDSQNYLYGMINLAAGQLEVTGSVNGAALPPQTAAVDINTSYNLRAVKLSDRVIFFVDGVEKLVSSTAWAPSCVGLINENMAAVYTGILAYQTEPKSVAWSWRQTDVGDAGFAGDADYSEGRFSISASGRDLWDLDDQCHFVYKPYSGDGDFITRLISLDPTNWWAKAAMMVRENLSNTSRMVYIGVNGGFSEVQFIWRGTPGGGTGVQSLITPIVLPGWLKLSRRGNTFYGYYSINGSDWTLVGSRTNAISSTAYVGLAITATDNTRIGGAVFDDVRIECDPILGDFDNNCRVDLADFVYLAQNWLETVQTWTLGDLDGNGSVTVADLSIFVSNWLSEDESSN